MKNKNLFPSTLRFEQILQWFNTEGEHHLQEAASVKNSGDRMEQVLNSFTGFLIEANVSSEFALFSFYLFRKEISGAFCASSCRTAGITPCRWYQRQRDYSGVDFHTRRQKLSEGLSATSN